MSPRCFLAIDWSGRATAAGQRRHIFLAAWKAGVVTLTNGYTHAEVCDRILATAKQQPALVVGLDFAFSFPAWWLREQGCHSVSELWQRAEKEGERWLREGRDPFWGRPGRPKPREQEGFRQTDRQLHCKSPFQIGGAGAVGTGSIRGMPMLLRLQQHGFHIWPFAPAKLPLVLEIYPRFFTGPVVKSSQRARENYLRDRRFANLPREVLNTAAGSEDAFDALCSVLGMVDHAEHLRTLTGGCQLEGAIWQPQRTASLEDAILELLDRRGPGKTICPSEAARLVDPSHWRTRMDAARAAAQRLAARGEIEFTQQGRAVDPLQAKGPIRLRRLC